MHMCGFQQCGSRQVVPLLATADHRVRLRMPSPHTSPRGSSRVHTTDNPRLKPWEQRKVFQLPFRKRKPTQLRTSQR